jgi:hypothetical protein
MEVCTRFNVIAQNMIMIMIGEERVEEMRHVRRARGS